LATSQGNSHFVRADSGLIEPVVGRGLAFGDINNDGWIDSVMSVLGGRPRIFMNRGGANNWLSISLRGTRSNRDGFGAVVVCNGQTDYATSAGSYLSASDKRIHFGLGQARSATIEIRWPSGIRQELRDVPANQILEIEERQ
jgi:hypothetical protein